MAIGNSMTDGGSGSGAALSTAAGVAAGVNPWMLGATIAAPILGGALGGLFGSEDRSQAKDMAAKAYQEALSLGMPPDLAKEVVLQKFKSAGTLTPELEQAINIGPSEVAELKEDPATRNAQIQALQQLQMSGRGLSPQDRAKFNQLRDETQRDAEAKRQQIMQSFAQRGMGGAGNELAAQLQQAQASANQASTGGDQIAAASAENALNSIRQAGDLSGQVRSQDFNVANTKASAADQFNRFNTENQISRQTRNIGSQNNAQATNLANNQDIANKNTSTANNELLRQNQAKRDYWDDQLKRTTLRSNAAGGNATVLNNQADSTAKKWAGVGSSVSSGLNAYNDYNNKK